MSKGTYKPGAGRLWSVRNYVKYSTPVEGLPAERHQLWAYYGLFPNAVFITTPETIQFYQEMPLDVNRSALRGITIPLPPTKAASNARPDISRSVLTGPPMPKILNFPFGPMNP